jgi:uncharacterized protein
MHESPFESRLLDLLRAHVQARPCVVCFSGGLDSTVVLAACLRAGLPTTALLAVSPSLAQAEREEAHLLASFLGAELVEACTGEVENPSYRANAGDRCYHCKSALYGVAEGLAAQRWPGALILNGTQADDLGDFRPGLKAAKEHGVFAPLLEAGLGKEDARELARAWGLPNAEKAAAPCLASRFPVGTEVTPERLAQVEAVEAFLRESGLWPARARWHDSVVRLEIDRACMARALEEPLRSGLERACWRAGFRFVALDLAGIQSGSLSQALAPGRETP